MASKPKLIATAKRGKRTVLKAFGPPNAFSDDANSLDRGLYWLSEILTRGLKLDGGAGFFGGEFGYGVEFENDVFMMHPFCWCEKEDCLWCGGTCGCPWPEPEYYVDGKRVTFDESQAASKRMLAPLPWNVAKDGTPEYEEAERLCDAGIKERDSRLSMMFPGRTHTCEPAGMFDSYERCAKLPFTDTPHFWHKPTGFKVRWYKYIGRSMETNRDIREGEWAEIFQSCIASLPKSAVKTAEREHKKQEALERSPEYQEKLGIRTGMVIRVMGRGAANE